MTDVSVLLGLANDASHGRLDADELSDVMATVVDHHGQTEATRKEKDFLSLQASPAVGGMLPGPMLLDSAAAADYTDLDAAHQDDHAMALVRALADQQTSSKGTAEHTHNAHTPGFPVHDSLLAELAAF